MIIGPRAIEQLVEEHGMISNTRHNLRWETLSVDLRLGELHEHLGGAVLRKQDRYIGQTRLIPDADKWSIKPRKYYLGRSMETVKIPVGYVGLIIPRTTAVRSALMIEAGMIPPGFDGEVTFGIFNPSQVLTHVQKGYSLTTMIFLTAQDAKSYAGVWSGGAHQSEEKEWAPSTQDPR